jgi:hypothetical protein
MSFGLPKVYKIQDYISSGRGSPSGGWYSWSGIGIAWCWSTFLFSFLSTDLVIQLLEECNKFLELLGNIVKQGKGIFDLIVQASHKCGAFCRVSPLDISSIILELSMIGRKVVISFFEYLQFLFSYYYIISVHKCSFQNCYQCCDISEVDIPIRDLDLDLGESLV